MPTECVCFIKRFGLSSTKPPRVGHEMHPQCCHPRGRGGPGVRRRPPWIPAFAGMTNQVCGSLTSRESFRIGVLERVTEQQLPDGFVMGVSRPDLLGKALVPRKAAFERLTCPTKDQLSRYRLVSRFITFRQTERCVSCLLVFFAAWPSWDDAGGEYS